MSGAELQGRFRMAGEAARAEESAGGLVPRLLAAARRALGLPEGTLLQAEDGRVFRSATPARGPDTFASPLARLVRLAGGAPAPPDTPLVDLRGLGRLQVLPPTA